MKTINKYIAGGLVIAVVGIFSASCKQQMIKVNTNPNSLPSTKPEYWFTSATQDFNLTNRTQQINRYTFMQYMQYIVPDGANANLRSVYWAPGANTGPAPASNVLSSDSGPVTYYNDYYNGIGVNLYRIIQQIDAMSPTDQANYQDLKAVCQIVNTYCAWKVDDVFGAMVYSQAFNNVSYPLPEYDYDWTLYKTFDSTLQAAATTLKAHESDRLQALSSLNGNEGNQDLFYGGNMQDWLAFANTLRIKIAQRYEKRDPTHLADVLTDIQNNFNSDIISSNDQSFGYNQTQGWNNNVDDIDCIFLNADASYALVQFLKATHDPRLSLMVRQNDFGSNSPVYQQIQQNGTTSAIAQLDSVTNSSTASRYWGKHAFQDSETPAYGWTGAGRFQPFALTSGAPASLGYLSSIQARLFVKNGGFTGFTTSGNVPHTDENVTANGNSIQMRTIYLSYAGTCFMMAEIAAKGGNGLGHTAAQWYNMGVQASFDQYQAMGVATNVPGADTCQLGDYLTRYPYNGLPGIYTQEWIALMTNPEESWDMWKRTGYPQFNTDSVGSNSGIVYLENLANGGQNMIIPRRAVFALGSSGAQLNQANFNTALQTLESKDASYGPNGNYTIGRVWWDMP